MMRVYLSVCVILAATVLKYDFALSHHAISANYDENLLGTIEGSVEEVFWANPHVHYYLEVTNDVGGVDLWDIETSSLIALSRAGWGKDMIEVGDNIRVSGQLGRNGIRRLNLDRDSLQILE
jgi:hypothetical protein|tara:strand:- start:387 stop:752 length:366 start_codon:yes stop_codon:yes gene_type:complete